MSDIPKFILDSKRISFDEKVHKYTLDGKELISVTTLISQFAEEFDKTGEILTKCAVREGVSEKVLQNKWRKKGELAATKGKLWHATAEEYIKTGKIRKNKFTPILTQFIRDFRFKGKLYPECILFDPELMISGTADLVQIIDNKICQIQDYKCLEKRPTDFGFKRTMLPPVSHLSDSKISKFSLQISFYLYILHSIYGYEIGDNNNIFWVDWQNDRIEKIPIELKLNEVVSMIAAYSYQKSLAEN